MEQEPARSGAVREYRDDSVFGDEDLQRMTSLAARVFDVPVCCITMVDEDCVWIIASHGFPQRRVPLDGGFCAACVEAGEIYVLEDTSLDALAAQSWVARGGIRFYAGAPLFSAGGPVIGTFCLMDRRPRRLDAEQAAMLKDFGLLAMAQIERRKAGRDLVRTEEALRDSERHYQTVAELSPVGIFRSDRDGRCTYVNRRLRELAGLSADEPVSGDGWKHWIHPEDREAVTAEWDRFVRQVAPFHCEYRFLTPGGVTAWVVGQAVAERDERGGISGFLGTVTDVTEQRLADQRLNSLVEATSGSGDGGILRSVLRHACQSLNVSAAYVCERSWSEEERGRVLELWDGSAFHDRYDVDCRVCADRTSALGETRFCKDGVLDQFPHDPTLRRLGARGFLSVPVRDLRGESIGSLAVASTRPFSPTVHEVAALKIFAARAGAEIDRRRQEGQSRQILDLSRQALQESEQRFHAIFEQAAVGIAQVDVQGRFLGVNRKLCEIVGYSAAELCAMTFQQVTYQEDLDPNMGLLHGALAGDHSTYSLEKRYVRKDGSTVWIHLSVSLVRASNGVPRYFISVIEDIQERKEAEAALRRTEERLRHVQKLESLGVLAGGVAHDFNNLLVGVLGNAGLLLSDVPRGTSTYERLKMIEQAAERAAELTNQMLAYSGQGTLVVDCLDLNELVEEMQGLLGMAVTKSVELVFNVGREDVAVTADGTQLRQVLMNLVANASDAIEGEGTITVSTGVLHADRELLKATYLDDDLPAGEYALLEVADTGCGMDEATMARIFDPFFTTKFTGRGLGLAAVLGIVRGHGGALDIRSRIGRGSTFRILLPLSADAPADRLIPRPEARPRWRGAGKVLVVEDEEVVQQLARTVLERTGFEVVTAADGAEGVELFRQHGAELVAVFLDVTMPRLGGEHAFLEMRAMRPDIPVLFTSGYNDLGLIERLHALGRVDFLGKPFSPNALTTAIQELLREEPSQAPVE